MNIRPNSPISVTNASVFSTLENTINNCISHKYLQCLNANHTIPQTIENFTNFVNDIYAEENTLDPEAFLDKLNEIIADTDNLESNPFITQIIDETLYHVESYINISVNLEDFKNNVIKSFKNRMESHDFIKTTIKQKEKRSDIVSQSYELYLSHLEKELSKLFPIFDEPSYLTIENHTDKRLKLFSILYQSYVVNTSLYEASTFELDHQIVKTDFKHIESLKFIEKIKKIDVSKYNHKEALLALPIEGIDFEKYKAIEWMPKIIEYIRDNPHRSIASIKKELKEINELCKDYAMQFMTWMILAINDAIKYDEDDFESEMAFGDNPLFGIETIADLRPATPIYESIENMDKPIGVKA